MAYLFVLIVRLAYYLCLSHGILASLHVGSVRPSRSRPVLIPPLARRCLSSAAHEDIPRNPRVSSTSSFTPICLKTDLSANFLSGVASDKFSTKRISRKYFNLLLCTSIVKDPLAVRFRKAQPIWITALSVMMPEPSGERAYQTGKGIHVRTKTMERRRTSDEPEKKLSSPSVTSAIWRALRTNIRMARREPMPKTQARPHSINNNIN